jgi:glyceraldehyde 3-phosphate dehydrogenase
MDLEESVEWSSEQLLNANDVQVVAINDLLDIDHLAYLLKYDSVHGNFDGTVEIQGETLVVNGNPVRITAEKDPKDLKVG